VTVELKRGETGRESVPHGTLWTARGGSKTKWQKGHFLSVTNMATGQHKYQALHCPRKRGNYNRTKLTALDSAHAVVHHFHRTPHTR